MAIDNAALMAAARALVKRLDYVHEHPSYIGVWTASQMHAGQYQGPQYKNELEALRALLKANDHG